MARYTNGWVKLWRKAALGDINSNFTRGGLFGALISMANIQQSKVDWKGKPLTLERGQIVTSFRELADLGSVDVKTVIKHLNYLALRETIKLEKSKHGILITFINFEQYAGLDAVGSTEHPHAMGDGMVIGMGDGVHYNKEIKNKRKKEIKNTYEFQADFDRIAKTYCEKFSGTTTGTKALERFQSQFKSQDRIKELETAMVNYRKVLDVQTWRSPKTTLETFLGTKKSGFFWTEWIVLPELATPGEPRGRGIAEILAERGEAV